MHKIITADINTLVSQASSTASEYLSQAIRNVDNALGEGYAAKHPKLLAAMISASGQDFAAAVATKANQEIAERLAEALEDHAEAIRAVALALSDRR